jgi:hypothetical protein
MEKKFQEELGHEINKSHKTETIFAFSILGVLAVALVAGAWWYLSKIPSYDTTSTSEAVIKKTESDTTDTITESSNLKTYTNITFNFSLKYLSDWTLTDKLPTSTTVLGKASETLTITSPNGYSFLMYVNPDGFGMEGKALYVNFENTTVSGGKITLGTRMADNGEADGTGFIISTNVTAGGNKYLPTMTGVDTTYAAAAEVEYKKIIGSMKIN